MCYIKFIKGARVHFCVDIVLGKRVGVLRNMGPAGWAEEEIFLVRTLTEPLDLSVHVNLFLYLLAESVFLRCVYFSLARY